MIRRARRAVLVHGPLLVAAVLIAVPFVWLVSLSLQEPQAVFRYPPRFVPERFVWSSYPDAWRAARERIRVGGLYVCDNVLWSGAVADPEGDHGRDAATTNAILEHNRLIADDNRFVSTIVPTRDGVFVALRVG